MSESSLFFRLCDLFNALQDSEGYDADTGLFTGSQAKVFGTLGLSNAYNPILFRALREIGSIETVRRGAGLRPSVLRLIQAPQIEQFDEWRHRGNVERALTDRPTLSKLSTELRLLERRLPQGVDLSKWIAGIEGRLERIEDHLFGDGDLG